MQSVHEFESDIIIVLLLFNVFLPTGALALLFVALYKKLLINMFAWLYSLLALFAHLN